MSKTGLYEDYARDEEKGKVHRGAAEPCQPR